MRGNGGPNGVSVWWPTGLQQMRPGERAAALELGWWRDGTTTITRSGKVFKPCADCGHDAEHDQGMCLFCHPPARPYSGADRSVPEPVRGKQLPSVRRTTDGTTGAVLLRQMPEARER